MKCVCYGINDIVILMEILVFGGYFNYDLTEGTIQDVYDGIEYKKHSVFLSNPANISFICNTDGVAIFRSSTAYGLCGWRLMSSQGRQVCFSAAYCIDCLSMEVNH